MFTDHKSSLDNMSHSQIRVVLEHLLMTMDIEQRNKFKNTFPGLYNMIYPNVEIKEDFESSKANRVFV